MLVMVQVRLMATVWGMGQRFPLGRGAWLGLVVGLRCGGRGDADGQAVGQFASGFALLASTDSGE